MISTAIILFREMLEVTLIIGIVMAATKDLPKRNFWLSIGVTSGVVVSLAFAYFTRTIASLAEGAGQELINAMFTTVAVMMIGWTVLWMGEHAKNFSANIKQMGQAVREGDMPLYAIATIIALAVIREGAEITLFLYGIINSSSASHYQLIAGSVLGAAAGILVGLLIYLGLVTVARKYIFSVTSLLLVFLAAGLAAQIPNYLTSAGILTEFSHPLWNSSWLLKEESITGKLLHTTFGYTEQPTPMQLAFYFITLSSLIYALYFNKADK